MSRTVGVYFGDGSKGGEIAIHGVPDGVGVREALSPLIWMGELHRIIGMSGLRAAIVGDNWPARAHYVYIDYDYAERLEF